MRRELRAASHYLRTLTRQTNDKRTDFAIAGSERALAVHIAHASSQVTSTELLLSAFHGPLLAHECVAIDLPLMAQSTRGQI